MTKKFLPLVGVAVIMALFIVWEQIQTTKYGYEVAKLQQKITDLREKNRRLNCEVNALKKPERIVKAIQSMGLDIASPLENRDRLARTKEQQQNPQKGQSTNTVVASAREESRVRGQESGVKTRGSKRKTR